jgi:hypothetical protein
MSSAAPNWRANWTQSEPCSKAPSWVTNSEGAGFDRALRSNRLLPLNKGACRNNRKVTRVGGKRDTESRCRFSSEKTSQLFPDRIVIIHGEERSHAAVIAMKDERWGETPFAFVELKAEARLDHRGRVAQLLPLAAGQVQDAATCDLRTDRADSRQESAEVQAAQTRSGKRTERLALGTGDKT